MSDTQYNPNGLLDAVMARHSLKNDAALARFLCMQAPSICRTRKNTLPVGDSLILRCVEMAGMTLAEVRSFVPSPYSVVAA